MNFTTSILRLILAFLCLSIVQILPNTQVLAQYQAAAGFEPPPGREGAPRGGTAGGGTRPAQTACSSGSLKKSGSLTALSPGSHVGLTQSDRPNFFVYLPKTTAKAAEFSLFDDKMNGIYQVSIPISPRQTGLTKIPLPDAAPSLAKEKPHYWTFALVCNESDRTEDWVVGGWIEHGKPNNQLKQQLTRVAGVERVCVYAKNGFWYDAVTELVQMQKTQPNNSKLAGTWTQLLRSVGLNAIASLPNFRN
jgi:Domain of Unknown Function (DUF928)